MEIALLTESSKVSQTDLAFLAAAVDAQMRLHFAPAWGIEPWPVTAYEKLPDQTDQFHPMFIMDNIGVPNALGYHDDLANFIYSRVLPPDNPNDGTTISHEALEEVGDPTCDGFRPMPDGRLVALEACDAVEASSYPVTVTLNGISRVIQVSNFCLPAFWVAGSKGPWDYLGQLPGPFNMLAGGYEIVQNTDGSVVDIFAQGAHTLARLLAFKRADPMSRTARRHALRARRRATP